MLERPARDVEARWFRGVGGNGTGHGDPEPQRDATLLPLTAELPPPGTRSAYRRTFCPGVSTCTPAITTVSPGDTPPASTTSLPSAPATRTGCCFTVMLARSTT